MVSENYSFSGDQRVCHEHFEESCSEAELQTRLGFRRFKRLKPGAVPTERKGPEAHKKKKAKYFTSSYWKTISL